MIQENEIVSFAIGCVVLVFALLNFRHFRYAFPGSLLLLLAFFFLFLSEIVMNLSSVTWTKPLHVIEHSLLLLNILMVIFWFMQMLARRRAR